MSSSTAARGAGKTDYSWNDTARLFLQFEEEYAEEIGAITIDGYLAWQIVKAPVYYALIRSGSAGVASSDARTHGRGNILRRLLGKTAVILRVAGKAIYMSVANRVQKERPLLFLTSTVDKHSRNKQEVYVNYLTDFIVQSGIAGRYVYAEKEESRDKRPALIRADFKINDLLNLRFLVRNTDQDRIAEAAIRLSDLLNRFFSEQHIRIRISALQMENDLLDFSIEKKLFEKMLGIVRPRMIISAEKIGSPVLAAAIRYRIPYIELQHGVINEYSPQYQYAVTLRPYKPKMILPSRLAVYGSLYKSILLGNDFWDEDELYVLGSSRIEIGRKNIAEERKSLQYCVNVLLPSQWVVFEDIKLLLRELNSMPEKRYRVILKPHPLESREALEYYHEIRSEYQQWFSVDEQNVYDILSNSKIVLGFDSAVLLEAAALGVPCITIGTASLPGGLHDSMGTDRFREAIPSFPISDALHIHELLNRAVSDHVFFREWEQRMTDMGDELYAKSYFERAKSLISSFEQRQL